MYVYVYPGNIDGSNNEINPEQKEQDCLEIKCETISLENPEEGLKYLTNCKGPKHLIVSFKIIHGSQPMVSKFMTKWMDIKSQMKERENIVCCGIIEEGQNSICPTMVSFNVLSTVDKLVLNILKENLVKAESEMCSQSGSFVSINMGCVKIKIKAFDLYHLQHLQNDIYSGQLASRIVIFLQKYGFPKDINAAMVLTVDLSQILEIRKNLENKAQELKFGNIHAVLNLVQSNLI